MDTESFVAGFGEFRKKQKLSTVDTSNFDDNDKESISIAEGEAKQQIKKLDLMRGEIDDEAYNLGVSKAKKPLLELESALISKYKPTPEVSNQPTNTTPKSTLEKYGDTMGKIGDALSINNVADMGAGVLEQAVAAFKPEGELAVNFLKKVSTAIGGTSEDVLNWLTNSDLSFYEKQREIARIEGEALNKTIDPKGDALLSPTETTAVVASLIPVTKAVNTMAGVEAGIGYSEEYANTGDIGKAATAGVVSGSIALLGGTLAEKFFPDGATMPTKFAKQIEKLGDDEALALTKALDNMDTKGIKDLSIESRTKLLDDIFTGSEDTADVTKGALNFFKSQKKADLAIKDLAYDEANAIARETKPIPTTNVFFNAAGVSKGTEPEQKALDQIEILVKGKMLNAEDMEAAISSMKGLQRKSESAGKNVYGEAIGQLQKRQDSLGGEKIYKKARELDTEYNISYLGKREGQGRTAGKQVANAIKNDYEEYIGAELLGSKLRPKNIGKAVTDLPEEMKLKVVQDLVKTGIDDINTAEGISQVLDNFYKLDPKGLEKILGKESAGRLKLDMDSLDAVQEAINAAAKVDKGIKQELIDITTAGLMYNVSPFLAARSAGHGIKKIVTKKMMAAKRGQLIARIQKIPNQEAKRAFTKAFAVMLSPKASEQYQKMQDNVSKESKYNVTNNKDVAVDNKVQTTDTTKQADVKNATSTNNNDAFIKGFSDFRKKQKEEINLPTKSKMPTSVDGKKKSVVEWGRGVGEYSESPRKRSITGATSSAPRNVRNNNLGNIKHNSNNNWEGKVDGQDKTFVTFKTPELGVRALTKVIKSNINATNSIETYVNRYASEPSEKEYYKRTGKLKPHLQSYANKLASSQGIKNTKIMPSSINMKKWIKATAIAEGGGKALKYFTDDVIERGIRMA